MDTRTRAHQTLRAMERLVAALLYEEDHDLPRELRVNLQVTARRLATILASSPPELAGLEDEGES